MSWARSLAEGSQLADTLRHDTKLLLMRAMPDILDGSSKVKPELARNDPSQQSHSCLASFDVKAQILPGCEDNAGTVLLLA